jgi:purine-binding chemotaxis protein CheW
MAGAHSYVLCELGATTYAFRSDDVEQLEMVGQLTPVPNAPGYVEGVTSVRGRVLPAVSLRARFGMERQAHTLRSRLIVVRFEGRSVGFIVDSAREFAVIAEADIQPPPEGIVELSTQYLRGISHVTGRLVLLLDVAELLRVTDPTPSLSLEVLPAISAATRT